MLRAVLKGLFRLLFGVRVLGDASPMKHGRLLVIANHLSFLDGVLLGLFLPIRPTFVVHTTVLKQPFFRMVLSQVPHLAVDPTSPMAMKKVIGLLESGEPVVIFPEGRITVTGSIMKVYDGPAFVAARTGATILPVRLDGPQRSYFSRLSGQFRRQLFPRITITLLPTTTIAMPEASTAKQRRRKAGEAMRRLMQEMVFSSRPLQTLFTAFLEAMEVNGRNARLLEDMNQEELSYRELLKGSLALGRLVAKFTKEGENVGVLLPNVSATVCMIFGMSAMRRVPAMLNYTAGSAGMQYACEAAGVRTIVSSRRFLETAKLAATVQAIGNMQLVYVEDLRARFTLADRLWLVLFALRMPRAAMRRTSPQDPAVVLFTSGSEGKPKGVVLSHDALLANVAQIRAVVDFSPADKFLVALPVFHAFGLTCGAIMPLVTGSRLFLYPSPLHYRVIPEVIYDRGCTVLFGTSTFLGAYARYAHPYDFFRLRYVVSGAEKLNEGVRRAWYEKFGIRIMEGYGATECAPVIAVNTPMAYRSGTVGTLLPGVEHRLQPVEGIGEGGILHVRGPNVMLGYYLHEAPGVLQPPVSDIGEGWHGTGDIVAIDEDGFLSIRGRVKRFAKIAGEMMSLEVVEKIAQTASPGGLHAAVAVADPKRGESLVLFTTDAGLEREAILQAARTLGAPELAVPRRIEHLKELPLLGTGKTDYVSLRRLAEAPA